MVSLSPNEVNLCWTLTDVYSIMLDRLLEYAPLYYDLSTFPEGDTKRALSRVQRKRTLKVVDGGSSSNGRNSPATEQPPKKKAKSSRS